MTYRGKKVLVTGAGGFIGSHLVEMLVAKGAKVSALLHYNGRNDWGCLEQVSSTVTDECEIIFGDITDSTLVRRLVMGKDVIFHLAALIGIPYSYIAPMSYLRTNIEGTVNVLEAARSENVGRVVHTSTSEVYGTAIYAPIDENHPLQGQSPYSASKIAADKMAESYYRSFDLPIVTIRPFNTFGPRQSARAVIPTIATQLLRGKERLLLGSLEPVRDMTYVADTVAGFLAAGIAPKDCLGEVINLGTGRGETVAEIVKILMKLVGHQVRVASEDQRIRPVKSEVFKLIADNSKAKQLLGWQPQYSLEDGLSRVVEYLRENLGTYKSAYAV
jgi:NAD dependent epimerase/dehydratase